MFYGPAGNNEYIEIYNLSYQPVNLAGYSIKYETSNKDTIISAGFGTVLPARSYAVVFEGDYSLDTGIYKSRIPPEALILKINNNAFGSNGMANTENRSVYLYKATAAVADSYYYSANNTAGIPDEKINLFHAQDPHNWANAKIYLGTPGFQNSVYPLNYDGAITSFALSPNPVFPGKQVTIRTAVKNIGLADMDQSPLNFYRDINRDSVGTPDELIAAEYIQYLAAGDSESVTINLPPQTPGEHIFIAELVFPDDENNENNIAYADLRVITLTTDFNEVVINEIMFAPTNDDPEWIELYNRGDTVKNLRNWKISDRLNTITLPDKELAVPPGGYLVIADDSSFFNFFPWAGDVIIVNLPQLNNSGDAVTLTDTLAYTIDSAEYRPWWGGSGGKSLERVSGGVSSLDSVNWKSSRVYATPAYINTVSPKQNDIFLTGAEISPAYPAYGNNISVKARYRNTGSSAASFKVLVYKDVNKDSIPDLLLAQSAQLSLAPGDSSEYLFPQIITSINAETYLFVKVLFPQDQDTTNNTVFKRVLLHPAVSSVIINEVMYAPSGGAPEWIEVVNRSGNLINLRNWKISDAAQTISMPDRDIFLPLLSYLVIADDSSFFDYYPGVTNVAVAKLPSLNNDGDIITMKDSTGAITDSMIYRSSWGGTGGKSLERVDIDASSLDSTNWKSSKILATPGSVNAVSAKIFDISVNRVEIFPEFPSLGDNINLTVYPLNFGMAPSEYGLRIFLDTNNDSIPDFEIAQALGLTLQPYDSAECSFSPLILGVDGEKNIIIKIIDPRDQDTTNNTLLHHLRVYTPASSVRISEIMYSPVNGMPEWVELHNTSAVTVDLAGWKISDLVTTPASVTLPAGLKINPGGYLVIADDSIITKYFRDNNYQLYIANLPPLNNDYDGVFLRDNFGRGIDTVIYNTSSGGKSGFSLERINSAIYSSSANFRECVYWEKGTPGRINSVTPKQKDVEVKSISLNPEYPDVNTSVSLSIKLKENGIQSSGAVTLKIYIDSLSAGKLLDSLVFISPAQNDSIILFTRSFNFSGSFTAIVTADAGSDDDTYNNTLHKLFMAGFSQRSLVISEVMHTPSAPEKEWIEIYNPTDKPADIRNWTLDNITLSDSSFLIPSKSFYVVTSDTGLAQKYGRNIKAIKAGVSGLTPGEMILLKDNRGAVIDTFNITPAPLYYNHHSVERNLNAGLPDLVHPSVDLMKATPGTANSIDNIKKVSAGIVVNEIMFDTEASTPEYIEMYNFSPDTINPSHINVQINSNTPVPLSPVNKILPPGGYYVVASDSSLYTVFSSLSGDSAVYIPAGGLSLSNGGASLRLSNIYGEQLDSLFYLPKWYGKNSASTRNRAVEKINPALNGNDAMNWSGSADPQGGTPGRANSMYAVLTPSSSSLSVSPNPFSPDDDGYEDYTIISYNLANNSNLITIKIFDGSGREMRTLADNYPSSASGDIAFDGRDSGGRPLPLGIYIIYLEAHGTQSGFVQKLKTVVVSARKL